MNNSKKIIKFQKDLTLNIFFIILSVNRGSIFLFVLFGFLIYDPTTMPIISGIIWGGILLSKIGEYVSKLSIWKWAMVGAMLLISLDRGSTIISYYIASSKFGVDPERAAEVEYLTNSGLWGLLIFSILFIVLHFCDKKYGYLYLIRY